VITSGGYEHVTLNRKGRVLVKFPQGALFRRKGRLGHRLPGELGLTGSLGFIKTLEGRQIGRAREPVHIPRLGGIGQSYQGVTEAIQLLF